jgi:lipoate-protein ligase B
LAVYSILALDHFQFGLQRYLEQLQSVLAAVLDDFNVPTQSRPGQAGVWVGNRPIATVGVAVRDWVTYYGAVLNINPPLEPYRWIRSGQLSDGPMTSLARERRGPLRSSLVRERFLEHFQAVFRLERLSLFSDHPSLHREAPSDAVATRP